VLRALVAGMAIGAMLAVAVLFGAGEADHTTRVLPHGPGGEKRRRRYRGLREEELGQGNGLGRLCTRAGDGHVGV
jgi:hypothetical protein